MKTIRQAKPKLTASEALAASNYTKQLHRVIELTEQLHEELESFADYDRGPGSRIEIFAELRRMGIDFDALHGSLERAEFNERLASCGCDSLPGHAAGLAWAARMFLAAATSVTLPSAASHV